MDRRRIYTNEIKLIKIPALTICWMGTKFEAKIIELGGVATGNIKAHEATIVSGKVTNKGFIPKFNPTLAITGIKVIVVVRLLVNSVSNKTIKIISAITKIGFISEGIRFASQKANPVEFTS